MVRYTYGMISGAFVLKEYWMGVNGSCAGCEWCRLAQRIATLHRVVVMAIVLKRRRVSGQSAPPAAVSMKSLAEVHRSEIGAVVESLTVTCLHAGEVRTANRITVCDLLVADHTMYMSVTSLGDK